MFQAAGTNIAGGVEAGDDGGVGGDIVDDGIMGSFGEARGRTCGGRRVSQDVAGGVEERVTASWVREEAIGEGAEEGGRRALADEDKNIVESIKKVGGGLGVFEDFDVMSFLDGFETALEVEVGLEVGVGDDGEIFDEVGEIEGFLNSGIGAADDSDVFILS